MASEAIRNSGSLTKNEKNSVLDKDWKNSNFYVLPKVHKCREILEKITECQNEYIQMNLPSSLKSRPICGGPTAVTQEASELLETILSPPGANKNFSFQVPNIFLPGCLFPVGNFAMKHGQRKTDWQKDGY